MKRASFFALLFFCVLSVAAQKQKTVLNHIAVYVTNLSKSTAFYQNIIGLDTIPEPFHDGKHSWFKVADRSQLHLIEGAVNFSPLTKNSHLCFSVASLKIVMKNLNERGVIYEDWKGVKGGVTTRVDGVHQIYFQDPDGYWIEINDDVH